MNWKTTIGGLMCAIGTVLAQIHTPEWVGWIGTALVAVGSAILGVSAKDAKTA